MIQIFKNLLPLSMLSTEDLKRKERQALDELYETMRTAGSNSESFWNKKLELTKVQLAINKISK